MSWFIQSWPEWIRLYWLLCIPIALTLLWALYQADKHQHDWRSLLPKSFHAILLDQYTNKRSNNRYWLLGCTWLLVLLALLGPSWNTPAEQPKSERHFAPLVIAIQLTPDMLANDLPPSRLHHIREKILSLLEQREAAFTALVVYAGSAHTLVPLSNDLVTSQNLLQALQPDLMPVPGQRADLAIERAIHLLQQGAEGEGQILLISTGISAGEHSAIEKLLKRQPIQLKIMGVGSTAGAPIMQSEQGYFVTDTTGAIVLSRLNETSLQLLSEHTNSLYTQLSDNHSDLHALNLLALTNNYFTTALAGQNTEQRDQGYWLLLPILLLALSFARRGSLLVLLVCLLPMQHALAFSFDDLWLRPDQQGAQYIEQQPALAAEYFTDLQWRATSLYLAGDYQAAAELFAQFDTPEAHYNRGNALALAGLLQEAIAAYKQALNQAPDMLAAQYNLTFIEDYLAAPPTVTVEEQTAGSTQESATSSGDPLSTTIDAPIVSDIPNDNGGPPTTPDTEQQSTANNSITEKTIQNNPPEAQPATILTEQQPVHLESWLEQIPDNPSELLKRKFRHEQNMQEAMP